MTRHSLAILAVIALAVLAFATCGRDTSTSPPAIPGEYLVGLDPSVSVLAVPDDVTVESLPDDPLAAAGVVVVRAGSSSAVAALEALPGVAYVEPNLIYSIPVGDAIADALAGVSAAIPSDPLISSQWQIGKVGAPAAWATTAGKGIVVAVLDTGTDCGHPDLVANLVTGYDATNGRTGCPQDGHGHGSHVGGTMAAVANGRQGVGVAWAAGLMPVKVLFDNGSGSLDDIARGILWAQQHGAKVINMSLGGPTPSITLHNAIKGAAAAGVIVVSAAGNNGTQAPAYPAWYPEGIAVGATTEGDGRASFSTYGSWVDIGAPGVGVYATTRGGGYGAMSGTSMASPTLAGEVALMLAAGWPAGQIIGRLQQTSVTCQVCGFASGRAHVAAAIVGAPAPRPTTTGTPPTASPTNTPWPTIEEPPTEDPYPDPGTATPIPATHIPATHIPPTLPLPTPPPVPTPAMDCERVLICRERVP